MRLPGQECNRMLRMAKGRDKVITQLVTSPTEKRHTASADLSINMTE
jgi:hypothetical protein